MEMSVILTISMVLAFLPLAAAAFFLAFTLPRKLLTVNQELRRLVPSNAITDEQAIGAAGQVTIAPEIQKLADKYFAKSSMVWPPLLLTLLYLAAFTLCDSYLYLHFVTGTNVWIYPTRFVLASLPVLYAFVGVYLFNLGTLIRRLYLGDLNEQVFWGATNRLLLSLGLALVIMNTGIAITKADIARTEPVLYFSIGFLANVILDWALEKTLQLLDIRQPKQDDLPLQMVRGIDIWKEYRLEEEGIENVQNLATANVLELAVKTHYSLRTLIDWIDQSIMLSRLTTDQVKALASQAMAISAIELAAAAPENNNGDKTFANALAAQLKVDAILMAATLDRLYEDEFVRQLWKMWQSGTETATTVRIPLVTKFGASALQIPPSTASSASATVPPESSGGNGVPNEQPQD